MGQAQRRKQLRQAAKADHAPVVVLDGQADFSSNLLLTYLSKEDQIDVFRLLQAGPGNWERRYPPVPEHAGQVAQVVVSCNGHLTQVAVEPVT